jgi:shikimate kinase
LPRHTLDTALSNAQAIKAWLKTSSGKIQNLIERRNEDYQDMAYMLHDTQQREHEARQEIAGLANAVQKAFDVVSQQSAELRRFTGMN